MLASHVKWWLVVGGCVAVAGCRPEGARPGTAPATAASPPAAVSESERPPAPVGQSEAAAATPTPNSHSAANPATPMAEADQPDLPPDSAPASAAPSTADAPNPPPPNDLFKGWETPRLAMVITGQQLGYIEPCGCAGLANQKGGLARRHTLIKSLRERGWPVLALDAGNQVRRFGPQSDIMFQVSTTALKTIGYQAIGLGEQDLRLSIDGVAATIVGLDGEPSPFLSANAAVLDRSLTPRFQVFRIADKTVGVTSVLGSSEQLKVGSKEVILESPEETLRQVWPELERAQCDLYVLLASASIEESQRLARAFPGFEIVASTGSSGDPPYQPAPLEGSDTLFIEVGVKGMFAVVIGVFDDPQQPLRYERVPLDSRFADSPEMLQLLASYQSQLEAVGLEGLGLQGTPHPSGNRFVGSETCGMCHTQAYAIWKETPHAHATDSLVYPNERSDIPRHFDPECLSCHVTGWHAQNFFPYTSGFRGLQETPALVGNGCENCHGPGSAHAAAEMGETNAAHETLLQLRQAMRLPLSKAEEKCRECHDVDNDPHFQHEGAFEEYWPQIEHKGLD